MRLWGNFGLFLSWFLSWSQSLCCSRVAPACVIVGSFEEVDWLVGCGKPRGFFSEAGFFGMVLLHWCAVLEAAGSRGADQSYTKPASLKWDLGLVCAKSSARAMQQEKEHLGYPSPEEQPQNSPPRTNNPLPVLFLKSCLAENRESHPKNQKWVINYRDWGENGPEVHSENFGSI